MLGPDDQMVGLVTGRHGRQGRRTTPFRLVITTHCTRSRPPHADTVGRRAWPMGGCLAGPAPPLGSSPRRVDNSCPSGKRLAI